MSEENSIEKMESKVSTYFGERGYTVLRKDLSSEQLTMIENDLTFLPNRVEGYGPPPTAFPVYGKSSTKLFIPKFYGIRKFGQPQERKIDQYIESVHLRFNGELRENQVVPVRECMKAAREQGGGILCLPCGFGKCLGKDTPVMMYDGSIKMVQDIRTGELLMGDDSKPRVVLSTCQGREQLYKIIPEKGDSYIVNESHILSLRDIVRSEKIDIEVRDYLQLPRSSRDKLVGYRVGVEFPAREIECDPYVFGSRNKHIPERYRYNSRDVRLRVLAGILDINGRYQNSKYVVSQDNGIDDTIYLARSLGFSVNRTENNKLIIRGALHIIPTKKRAKREIEQKDVLSVRIRVKKLDMGEYYGFEIDGNRRFLLGDFTVTHNTSIALNLITQLKVKALVVVAKEFLMEQWIERIKQFVPDARVGVLRQKKQDIENKDIVIGMLQSISMCEYDIKIYRSFGIIFYDEVHCVPSRVFSRALRYVQTKYHFGLSATPNRADGMTKVTKMFIGPIVYRINKRTAKKNPKNIQVIRLQFSELPNNECYRERRNFRGKPDIIKMITKLTDCPDRLAFISSTCRYFIEEEKRHILVLSDRVQYLKDIERQILCEEHNKTPFKIGYYIGACTSNERKETEKADLILATYAMAKEAMDIPILDTLVMATPKGNAAVLEQCIGRILRQQNYADNRPPLVIDLVDEFSTFSSQAWRRNDYYRKAHYPTHNISFDDKTDVLWDLFSDYTNNFLSLESDDSDDMMEESDKIDDDLSFAKPEVSDQMMEMILSGAKDLT